ncbi:prolyl-tRNA synthetase associated domain-containing protein [Kordiimonas aestuarii]|uniref:prolyl-tRNA synthetase associated domain-containing protein n=1 Tax=Kordiimonas aestuarii TaxID=1005925 RepID=UPI0021D16912|nr:prolyl-tRNA synthetase associated domain-containing protein [Kordiimonas aestuarii]
MESPKSEQALYAFLEGLGIEVRTYRHEPVFTVEDAQAARISSEGGMPGAHTKNLFVRDKKKRRALITLEENRKVDLRTLADRIALGRLSFGSADSLMSYLGVVPGSVTPLALYNNRVLEGGTPPLVFAIDKHLLDGDLINVHPLHNAATTAIKPSELMRFVQACGYTAQVIDFDTLS